jgi:threonine/homoserine/homoserine lactone efflux protein
LPTVIDTSRLLAFVVTSFVLIIIPGPSVLFVISRAVAWGRKAALATVVGNSAGFYVQVMAIALGVGVVVQRSVLVFSALKLAGAGYLVYLGIHTIRDRTRLTAALNAAATTPRSSARVMRQGFVVGLTNPKTMVFLTAILPEFVNRSRGQVPAQFLLFGLVFVLIALVCDSTWGMAAGAAREWFARSPRRLRLLGGAGGLVMIGLGIDVAASGRKR